MASLNDTITNDEEFAFILQTEEISRVERLKKRNNKFDTKDSLRYPNGKAHKPNYICIDDEIITLDDDDNDTKSNLINKDELLKNDELLARKLQEELDKEAAQTLEKNQRYRRRDQTDPSDFMASLPRQDSLSPDLDYISQPRPKSTMPNFSRLDNDVNEFRAVRRANNDTNTFNTNSFDLTRRMPSNSLNSGLINSNRSSRRNDLRQNLNSFINRQINNNNIEVSDVDNANSNTDSTNNLDDMHAQIFFDLAQPFNSFINNNFNSTTNHRSNRTRVANGLNLNNDLGLPTNRRTNRRVNHLLIINQFNTNNNDFTPEDYEDLLRLDELNAVKRGVKKEEYDSLPKFEYKSANFDPTNLNESDRTCSICQDEYENRVKLTILACSHKFHHKCIKEWLVQSRRCPLCQKDAITGD